MQSHDSTTDDELPRWFTWSAIGIGVVGLLLVVLIIVDTRDLHPEEPCRPGETGRCAAYKLGYVSAVDADSDKVTIRYDDGTPTEQVVLGAVTEPGFGNRVKVHLWDGDVIAVRDLSSERDYRTLDWPNRAQLILGAFVTTFFALLALGFVASAVGSLQDRRSRRRAERGAYAARSNGKP